MMERSPNFYLLIMEAVEQQAARARSQPINFGGVAGPDGGSGSPPAGFLGQLIQRKVTYDSSESAYLSGASSLVDNLAHIRYRLNALEAGSGGSSSNANDTLAIEMAYWGW